MSLPFLLQRLLVHVTAAALTLFVVLLIGEKFVPGSVLPFIDLVDAGIAVLALLVLTALFSSKNS